MDGQTTLPEQLTALIEQTVSGVQRAVGIAPDFTSDTLPLVDAYLRQRGEAAPLTERDHLCASVGAYFGEVMRRELGGRWAQLTAPPLAWRIELAACFLHFRPVGMTGEVLMQCEDARYDGAFATLPAMHDALAQMLEQAPPYSSDDYYSLTGRAEILQGVAEWLIRQASPGSAQTPRWYSAADYCLLLDPPASTSSH